MSLITIEVQSTRAVIRSQEPLTVGLRGAKVHFNFGQDWENLTKTAVFRQGERTVTLADVKQEAVIPWEVLTVPGVPVEIGIYGIGQGKAIPTLWTTTQPVRPGADPQGDPSVEPTPGLWEQMQSQLGAMEEAVAKANEAVYPVTVYRNENGDYWADRPDSGRTAAYRAGKVLLCYWPEHDLLLPLTERGGGHEFIFRAVKDGYEYCVKLKDPIQCSRKSLVEEVPVTSVNGQTGDVVIPTSVSVTVTEQSDGSYTADLSHDQLLEAYNNGATLCCKYSGKILSMIVASKSQIVFGCVYTGHVYMVTVGISRVSVATTALASNEASVLYTPQDLTPEQQAQARQNLGLDELPTGGGSGYRLIAKIVFDGSHKTKYIKITQDMDGKPLELTKVLIYADWLAATSRADCKLKLNNIDFQWFFNIEQTAYKNVLKAEMFDDLCYINYHSKIPGTSKAEGGGVYAVNIPELKINEIVWRTLGVNPPPNGSTFAVYGY